MKGIITAKAVTLFESSLRCGASGAKRLPCPSGQINQNKKKLENSYKIVVLYLVYDIIYSVGPTSRT
ncbi:TPA: hypothetical protein G8N32_004830 [Salmonella enterica]|nr:hypothetical protein [Salmonella enterica]